MGSNGPLSLLLGVPGTDGPHPPSFPEEPDPHFKWFLLIMGSLVAVLILAIVL